MAAVSLKQKKFMGAEIGRLKKGKKTKTGMSKAQLTDFMQVKVPDKHGRYK